MNPVLFLLKNGVRGMVESIVLFGNLLKEGTVNRMVSC